MSISKKVSIEHMETPYGSGVIDDASTSFSHDTYIDYDQELEHYSKLATDFEHNLTISDAIRYYKRAIVWSICLSTGIIMEAFDSILITSFFAFPSFTKRFGLQLEDGGEYEISSTWQMLLGASPFIGLLTGTMINGVLTEKFGHRRVILGSLIIMTLFIFISFYATSIEMLLVGQIFCGIPWGVFATIGPTYSSEICPTILRGYLTSYVNMCWALGQCLAAIVLSLLVNDDSEWGYRIPLAVQWVWPLPLFIFTWLAPESPWWLVRTNQLEKALTSIKQLTSSEIHDKAPWILSMIIHTNKMEKSEQDSMITSESLCSNPHSRSNSVSRLSLESDPMLEPLRASNGMNGSFSRTDSVSSSNTKLIRHSFSESNFKLRPRSRINPKPTKSRMDIFGISAYKDCFKSINTRRTEISCVTMAGQTLCGAMFAYSPSYFFSQIGINANITYKLNLMATIFSVLGTLGSWILLNKFGRRTIYLWGLSILSVCLLFIGCLQTYSNTTPSVKWYQCILTMVWVTCYSFSIGPLTFTIVSEISSTKLRSPTMAIARGSYNVIQVLCLVLEVQLINPAKFNLKGYTAFVWFIPCSLTLLWGYFRLPETRYRTYGELDLLFEHKVPARHFATCNVEQLEY